MLSDYARPDLSLDWSSLLLTTRHVEVFDFETKTLENRHFINAIF